jgi:hypothetical protein
MHPLGELDMPGNPALPFQMPPESSPLMFTFCCSGLTEGGPRSDCQVVIEVVVGSESSYCVVVVSS